MPPESGDVENDQTSAVVTGQRAGYLESRSCALREVRRTDDGLDLQHGRSLDEIVPPTSRNWCFTSSSRTSRAPSGYEQRGPIPQFMCRRPWGREGQGGLLIRPGRE